MLTLHFVHNKFYERGRYTNTAISACVVGSTYCFHRIDVVCSHFLFGSAPHLNKQMIQYVFIISNSGCCCCCRQGGGASVRAHKTYRHWKMNLKTKIVINVDFIFFPPSFSVLQNFTMLMVFYFSRSISPPSPFSRSPSCHMQTHLLLLLLSF